LKTRLLILMVLTLAVTSTRADDIIKKVRFIGEKPTSQIALYNRPGRVFQPDSLSSDSLKIITYYQQQGWYHCAVSYDIRNRSGKIEIVYDITKNERYILTIEYNISNLPESNTVDLVDIINIYQNKPASASEIGNLADEIIGLFSANGYPYCEVRFTNLRYQDPNLLSVTLDIQAGPLVTVERIDFPGRQNLDNAFLQKFTDLIPPFTYSTDKLALGQRRLSRTDFISNVDNSELRYIKSPEKGVVVFPIKEVSQLILDGALGYASNDDQFYGRLSAVLSNILGKGRQAKLMWSRKDKSSRYLKIGFTEPYLLGMPFRFGIDVYQDDRDSLFIETGGDIGFQYLSSDIYSYGVSIGTSQLNPELYGRTFLPHKNRLKLSVSFSADTRDYQLNPREGDYLFLKGDFVSETIKADSLFAASNKNYRTAELKLEKYLPLSNSSVIFGGLTAQADFSDNVPVDRLLPLGGFGSLRGYMQDIFYVSRKAIGTIQYRLLTSRTGRAYIFADMAAFQMPNSAGDGSATKYEAGFGIGLAAAVKFGTSTVEIAIPRDEGLSAAKLHFGIRTGF